MTKVTTRTKAKPALKAKTALKSRTAPKPAASLKPKVAAPKPMKSILAQAKAMTGNASTSIEAYRNSVFIKAPRAAYGSNIDVVAEVRIEDMPGCCGVGILTRLNTARGYRNKGLGALVIKLALHVCRLRDMGKAIATGLANGTEINAIADSIGAKKSLPFTNPGTGNKLVIFTADAVRVKEPLGFTISI